MHLINLVFAIARIVVVPNEVIPFQRIHVMQGAKLKKMTGRNLQLGGGFCKPKKPKAICNFENFCREIK